MKKVSLVQVNFQQGPDNLNAYYLPYSIGCLWSYANSFPEINENYQLDRILWRREDVEQIATKLADQDLIAFSCYIWNRTYNYALAKEIKRINSECVIVFGGPELPVTDSDLFRKHPYIDFVIKREGEIVFKDLLCRLSSPTDVPGLLINQNSKVVDTGDAARIDDLSQLTSPYLSGFFDRLIKEHPDVEWMATLETNRGCPYQCTFCDWGSLTYSKIKLFPLEKVFAELEWISRNRCGTIYVADANFGIFPERDNQIVDRFKELQKTTGFPYLWGTTWAKNQKKEVVAIIKKLCDNSEFYNLGLNISLQSVTDQVLTNIKRKNMHDMAIKDMFKLAERNQVPVWTELILGLPGETLASWKENFYHLFRSDIHTLMDVSICQLLENAEMNLVQREIYDIKTTEIYDYLSGTRNSDRWQESISIVTSTADLPPHDMMEAVIFTWFITTFHMNNFSNLVSRFLFKQHGVDYDTFYERLYHAVRHDEWCFQQISQIKKGIESWFSHGKMEHPGLSNGISIHSWNIFMSSAMQIHLENRYDQIRNLVAGVANSFGADPGMLNNVMQLQKLYLVDLHNLHSYPIAQTFDHNFYDFISGEAEQLIPSSQSLTFDFRHKKTAISKEYVERIFYSRKTDFSRTTITKSYNVDHDKIY